MIPQVFLESSAETSTLTSHGIVSLRVSSLWAGPSGDLLVEDALMIDLWEKGNKFSCMP